MVPARFTAADTTGVDERGRIADLDALQAALRPCRRCVAAGIRVESMPVVSGRADAEAMLVEVRVPALGVVWQGVEGFRVAGAAVAWNGRGGWIARRLEGWAGPLTAHGVWLSRFDQRVPLPPNERIWIVRDRRQLRFLREAEMSVPELPPSRVSAAASRRAGALSYPLAEALPRRLLG